jgi:hypothetical protein
MSIAGKSVIFTDAITLRNNSPTVRLNNQPTLIVSRSSSDPQTKPISFAGNIQCVNFINPVAALLLSATLIQTASYLFVNTGLGKATLTLDNGGTVGGLPTFILASGQAIEFQFDGQNLS